MNTRLLTFFAARDPLIHFAGHTGAGAFLHLDIYQQAQTAADKRIAAHGFQSR
jgi:hypothetical protein